MFCSDCGTNLPGSPKFCPECGTAVHPGIAKTTKTADVGPISEPSDQHLKETLPRKLEKALAQTLMPSEMVLLKIKGLFTEGLICTDKRVIILKGGFLAGQMFGTNLFQCAYRQISSADIKLNILTGYFELSTAGMQQTEKKFWSNSTKTDPAKAANCISLSRRMQPKFRDACNLILNRMASI